MSSDVAVLDRPTLEQTSPAQRRALVRLSRSKSAALLKGLLKAWFMKRVIKVSWF